MARIGRTDRQVSVQNFGSLLTLGTSDQADHNFLGPAQRGPDDVIYNTFAGTDILAEILLPNVASTFQAEKITLGELQTISYSIHRENTPVRFLGHVSPGGFVKGPRTIAGSLIFTVFNYYAFYRLKQFSEAVGSGFFPLADMLPPFDVVITFVNEVGAMSKMKLMGVTIVDEGQTMSVDDLITEQTYSYMARGIQPMTGMVLRESSAGGSLRTADSLAMDFNR
jgi:hypothetical protein